jgi:hypothetical protein
MDKASAPFWGFTALIAVLSLSQNETTKEI